jgi:hypothetical protein
VCNRKIQWPAIPVWWQKKGYCSDMPSAVSPIDGTSREIQIPSNEPQQKNILSANQLFSLIDMIKGNNKITELRTI